MAFWLLAFWFVLGAGDVFLTECQTRVVDGFSMVEVDCGALESQFVRLCSSADTLNRSDMPVFDIDSPVVRSAFRANKQGQCWSFNHFLFPQRPFLKKPYAPTPLLPSMSVSPPEKPLSWVSLLADQHQTVLSNYVSLGPSSRPQVGEMHWDVASHFTCRVEAAHVTQRAGSEHRLSTVWGKAAIHLLIRRQLNRNIAFQKRRDLTGCCPDVSRVCGPCVPVPNNKFH